MSKLPPTDENSENVVVKFPYQNNKKKKTWEKKPLLKKEEKLVLNEWELKIINHWNSKEGLVVLQKEKNLGEERTSTKEGRETCID